MYSEHFSRQCHTGSYGAERTVRGAIYALSVQPVLRRVEGAAVDVSDRRNPVTSSAS